MSKIEKLELKHLAGYLPYGLKFLHDEEKTPYTLVNLGIEHKKKPLPVDGIKGDVLASFYLEGIIPLVRPLSDLGKEATRHKTNLHQIAIDLGRLKDDNFIFQYDYSDSGSYGDKSSYAIITPSQNKLITVPQKGSLLGCSYEVVNELIKNHYDVFGWIESGLAIDINTVKL